jgi:predicted dehydrogenase
MAAQFAEALRMLPDARIQAVGSRSETKAAAFASSFGALTSYGGYTRVVADPAVDVVYIATPHTLHRDHALLALSAGKPVLCEKPFTTNAAEAREVVALARERRLFCMDGLWTRFVPLMARAVERVTSGEIGEPRTLVADFGIRVTDPRSRALDPALAGGALLDLGVYLVSLAHQVLGPPEMVSGQALLGETGVDEHAAVVLRHREGRISLLHTTLRARTPTEALVVGTEGQMRIHSPFIRPHRVTVTRHPKAGSAPTATADGRGSRMGRVKGLRSFRWLYLRVQPLVWRLRERPAETFDPDRGNGYQHEARAVMDCLRAGLTECAVMPLDETVAILETMDTLRGQWGLVYPHEGRESGE